MRRRDQRETAFAPSGCRIGCQREAPVAGRKGKRARTGPRAGQKPVWSQKLGRPIERNAEPGNRYGVSHGAYAQVPPSRLNEQARKVFHAVAEDAPVRAPDGSLPAHDAVAVRLLAETLCRIEDVQGYIAEHGFGPGRKRSRDPMRALEMEDRLMRRAMDQLDALGMTPRSRAKLGLDLARAADLATAMSEPDPVKRERLLREAGVVDAEED